MDPHTNYDPTEDELKRSASTLAVAILLAARKKMFFMWSLTWFVAIIIAIILKIWSPLAIAVVVSALIYNRVSEPPFAYIKKFLNIEEPELFLYYAKYKSDPQYAQSVDLISRTSQEYVYGALRRRPF